jgi:hypothetical protein
MAISRSGVTSQNPSPIGSDKMMAVKRESCLGERFFALNIGAVHRS